MEEAYRVVDRLGQNGQFTHAECLLKKDMTSWCVIIDSHGNTIGIEEGEDGKAGFIIGEANTHLYGGELDLNIQQLVDLVGEPQWVFSHALSEAWPACICDAAPSPTPYPHIAENTKGVELAYLEKGAAFVFEVPPEDIGCICPQMKLVSFWYFPPATTMAEYVAILKKYNTYSHAPTDLIEKQQYVPWQGFGPKYSGENP